VHVCEDDTAVTERDKSFLIAVWDKIRHAQYVARRKERAECVE
jgi:hypothetical protein